MRGTKLYIDLNAIDFNLKSIKSLLNDDVTIMPVIKANAYGIGNIELREILNNNNINIVSVALAEEGEILRNNNFDMPIVILNQPLDEEIDDIIKYDLTPGIALLDFAKSLNNKAIKPINVHIEVDTGMGRTGVNPENVVNFVKEIQKLENLNIEGIYTHFSSSDTSKEYTNLQIERFNKVLEELKRENIKFKYVHACNSAGLIFFKEAHYNMVRPGIALYGYHKNEESEKRLELRPSVTLKSKVSFIKEVEKDTPISYDRKYITDKKSIIATVPVGYADGIRKCLSKNNGRVFVNGKYANILGSICMDSFMIDVTDIPDVNVGTEVVIFDKEHITLKEIATKCDTIDIEILSTISNRVPRMYLR